MQFFSMACNQRPQKQSCVLKRQSFVLKHKVSIYINHFTDPEDTTMRPHVFIGIQHIRLSALDHLGLVSLIP